MIDSVKVSFQMCQVNQLTAGRSLTANIALVKNNAQFGARVAASLSGASRPNSASDCNRRAVVIGGIAVDTVARPAPEIQLSAASSTPGSVARSVGGVAGTLDSASYCCMLLLCCHVLVVCW